MNAHKVMKKELSRVEERYNDLLVFMNKLNKSQFKSVLKTSFSFFTKSQMAYLKYYEALAFHINNLEYIVKKLNQKTIGERSKTEDIAVEKIAELKRFKLTFLECFYNKMRQDYKTKVRSRIVKGFAFTFIFCNIFYYLGGIAFVAAMFNNLPIDAFFLVLGFSTSIGFISATISMLSIEVINLFGTRADKIIQTINNNTRLQYNCYLLSK